MKRWTIYCHTHVESGRRYIGLTSQTMEKRWKNHINAAKNAKGGRWHFPNAIRKYGPTAFEHEVLAMSWDLEDANAAERVLIEQWDTQNPEKGFNLAPGGSHAPHPIRKNPWDCPEYREKMTSRVIAWTNTPQARANNKAALNTPESKTKRSTLSKAALNTPESRAKRSAAVKGKKLNLTDEQRRKLAEHGKSVIAANPHLIEQLNHYRASSQPEVRTKISESMKRFMQNEEVRTKMSIRNTGRKLSQEERAKISERLTGKKLSPERIAKISLFHKGRTLSIEHKTKISESCKIARQNQTHCKRGHSLSDAYIRHDGRRSCRPCHKLERINRLQHSLTDQ